MILTFFCIPFRPTQYAHDVVLTSVRRRFNVMDVVWVSKRCRVLTGLDIQLGAIYTVKNKI